MSSYMNSMLKLILEEQERGIVWSPTSYQGASETSTSREYQPNGNYVQGNQCGYGERFQSSEMNCDYGALYSSPISNEEENYNLLKLILEEQEKYNESLCMIDTEIGAWTQGSRVFEATHVEPINTNLTRWIEEQEEECIPLSETKTKEVLPNDIGEVFEENAQIKDEFLQEAKESIREFELLLKCTVDENLVVRYEEQVEPVAILSYSTKSNEKKLGVVGKSFEEPCEGVLFFEYMVRKHLGTISTNEVSIDEPRKILFEEIRMKKFRGWYYDEYDPGDIWIHLTLFHRFLKLLSLLEMAFHYWTALFLLLSCLFSISNASAGDADPDYRTCISECEISGCVGQLCFPQCNSSSDGGPWYIQEPLYLQWKKWGCQGDCRYQCMVNRERERETLGQAPVKYHGKWPFKRVLGIQEPASVAFSVLNLAMHFHGWLSFFITLYYKLPLKQDKSAYYEYVGLWHIYGLLSMNSWFWSAVFHSRDVDLTERLDYSSAIAVLGFSLILAILRTFDIRVEATRVMVSAPILAFVTTHILYINFYKLDYGWNMIVCVAMGVTQLFLWARWAAVSSHPSNWKLWVVVIAGGLAMLLEIYDFPPYEGYFDAHSIWHAATIPLTILWWSFIRDDAEFRTSSLLKKTKTKAK